MRTITPEEAIAAIELLVRVSDTEAGFPDKGNLGDDIADFLFDDRGDCKFDNEPRDDWAPDCNCQECPSGGPYTCIRRD